MGDRQPIPESRVTSCSLLPMLNRPRNHSIAAAMAGDSNGIRTEA